LVSIIISNLRGKKGNFDYTDLGKIDTLVALLQSRSKGFGSLLVDGEWNPVLSRQGEKSPKLQRLVDRSDASTPVNSFSNFNVKELQFENINFTRGGNGVLKAIVKYNPVAENFDKSADGKNIVLRRIACDIIKVSFKFWRFPKVPLPLKRKGGYLDFLYLDKDIRVTKGNRGSLFVHFRPEYLEKVLSV